MTWMIKNATCSVFLAHHTLPIAILLTPFNIGVYTYTQHGSSTRTAILLS